MFKIQEITGNLSIAMDMTLSLVTSVLVVVGVYLVCIVILALMAKAVLLVQEKTEIHPAFFTPFYLTFLLLMWNVIFIVFLREP